MQLIQRITNYSAIDEYLPKAILDTSQIMLSMAGSIVVTAIVNPLFLIPVFVMSFIFIFIRRAFLKTAKNIKRLEGNGELFKNNEKYQYFIVRSSI